MEEEFCKGHSNRMPITLRRRPNRAIRLRPDPLKGPGCRLVASKRVASGDCRSKRSGPRLLLAGFLR